MLTRSKYTNMNMVSLPNHGRVLSTLRNLSTKMMITRSHVNYNTVFHCLPYNGRVYSTFSRRCLSTVVRKIKRKCNTGLFYKLLSMQGHKFEKMVLDDLKSRSGAFIPSVSTKISDSTVNKTLKYMQHGYKIIHSAPLSDGTVKGVADFLVRSDCMHYFFKTSYLSLEEKHIPCSLSNSYHYVVIDVKYITLALKSDGIHMKNTENQKYAKAQLYRYNQLLGKLQGYAPNKAFIIGRQYKYVSKTNTLSGNTYDEKLGVVNFNDEKEYIESFVKESLVDYSISTDITEVWNCSDRHSKIMQKHNIRTFMNPKCNAKLLGITGFKGFVLDCILDTQRQNDNLILPDTMPVGVIPHPTSNEYFVDFEVIPEVLTDKLNNQRCNRQSYIFLIGLGWKERGDWQYKCLRMKSLNHHEETNVMKEFLNIIPEGATLYHWSHAEPRFWNTAIQHRNLQYKKLNWVDLSKMFTDTPITLKGCLNFQLKNIANTMYRHEMIDTQWTSGMDGLECGARAVEQYKNGDTNFNDIIQYNEVDCKVLMEILSYLREKYSEDIFLL